jgi:hypothetical protein
VGGAGGEYAALGFTEINDEAFRALVLGRIIEPTSKLDTIRVLDELGVGSLSLSAVRSINLRISHLLVRHRTGVHPQGDAEVRRICSTCPKATVRGAPRDQTSDRIRTGSRARRGG